MDRVRLTAELKSRAWELGFALSGACSAVTPQGIGALARWLAEGFAGEMAYLADRQAAYEHPRHVLPGARSLLMLGMPYDHCGGRECGAGEGQVARYARGTTDYHDHIHELLRELVRLAETSVPGIRVRGVVDTAPLLEREFAQLAGLGWVGKNTMLLNRQHGSWFFLAALLLDCELDYDQPSRHSYCGSCTACLDACPTQAFPEPYVLDATRCISYLTIELHAAVPQDQRTAIGSWLFGCDICQEVCPWNHLAARTAERTRAAGEGANIAAVSADRPEQLDRSAADLAGIESVEDLSALLQLDDEWFRRRFRHTAFWRARRRGLLRNAALVLGNHRSPESHDALAQALQDPEPLVRGAAAWALGQIGSEQAQLTLRKQLPLEHAPEVRAEIAAAIGK